ncbi:MAG: hypothetical protein R2789_16165 [Microthrixaceae bacterium]
MQCADMAVTIEPVGPLPAGGVRTVRAGGVAGVWHTVNWHPR